MNALIFVMGLAVAALADDCGYGSVCDDHTNCIYSGFGDKCGSDVRYSGVTSDEDKQAILDAHNKVRSRVALGQETRGNPGPQPPAADMHKLEWDGELAAVAQYWADQCSPSSGHDPCRNVDRFSVGQNLVTSSSFGEEETDVQEWDVAMQSWYNEVNDFSKDIVPSFKPIPDKLTLHYSQLVWGETRYVGCGFVAYKGDDGRFNKYYVCNYGPGGNVKTRPMYQEGPACSKCTGACENGLCV
ncbi:venom allergen 5-like [Periplaneta americana]|uniref:venom allergen 5-like n=1 Tax=Periplaneta americana TaxID=6978 RepID=UPI0037E8BB57